MAAVYPLSLEAFLKSDAADLDGTVNILAVTAGYVYSAAHNFLDDVGAGFRLGTAVTLGSKTFTSGVFAAGSFSYTGVAAAAVIAAFVGYISTGVESTSRLIWYEDKNADGTPISFVGDGNPIACSFPNAYVFSI